jgi:uncharacterized protein YndB with AHSA1/START domain
MRLGVLPLAAAMDSVCDMEIRAARAIAAPPARIFEELQDCARHVELVGPRVEPLAPAGARARLRLRGPGGLRRTMTASLTYTHPPDALVARLEAGRNSRATLRWSIQRSDIGSWVQVVAHTEALGALDAALLRLGGRRWLTRLLESALVKLEEHLRPRPGPAAPNHETGPTRRQQQAAPNPSEDRP